MSNGKGIWFVYRSHYEGALSKRVCRIEAPSILAWFQEKIADARGSATPRDVATADLGGYVYGFGSLLQAAREHKLAAPKSMTALRAMLHKHLYVEGGSDNIRVDEHSVRVLTDDDEVKLAYYFFDDDAAREHQDRIAWLLEEDPALLDGDEDGDFEPPPRANVRVIEPRGAGEGATYACLFTFADGDSLPGAVCVLPGVRMEDLVHHLREVVPSPSTPGGGAWPFELRLLRAMIDPGDRTIGPALRRCSEYPIASVQDRAGASRLGFGPLGDARAEMTKAAEGLAHPGDPSKSFLQLDAHMAILCAHTTQAFGFQQWVFFDDRWANASPDLASSLLLYGSDWDPFPPREVGFSLDDAPPTSQERAWTGAVEGRGAADARRYKPSERFAAGELIDHTKFGLGVVRRVEPTKIEVVFKDATRTLAQGAG